MKEAGSPAFGLFVFRSGKGKLRHPAERCDADHCRGWRRAGSGGGCIATRAGGDSGGKRETVAEATGHFISTQRAAESGAIVHAPLYAAAFLDRAVHSAACAPRVNWLESDTSAPRESRGATHRGVAARGGGIDAEAAPQRFLAAGIFLAGIARRPSENGPRAQYRSKRSGCGNRGGGVRSR